MNKRQRKRLRRLLPNGIPRYIRVYDSGGDENLLFCRKCLYFAPAKPDKKCPREGCGHLMIAGGDSCMDRYTVIYSGNFAGRCGRTHYVGMSSHPFHPQGFGQHGDKQEPFDAPKGFPAKVGDKAKWGDGSSRRVTFEQLPPDCKKLVLSDYREIWGLGTDEQTEFKL